MTARRRVEPDDLASRRRTAPGRSCAVRFSKAWTGSALFFKPDDGDRAVCEHEIEVAVDVEIDPRRSPAGEARVERRRDVGARVGEHRPAAGRRASLRKTAWSCLCEFVTRRSVRPSPL